MKYETVGICGTAGGDGTGVAGTGMGAGVAGGVADGVDTVSGGALANSAEGRGNRETAVRLGLPRNASVVDARATLAIKTSRPARTGRFISTTDINAWSELELSTAEVNVWPPNTFLHGKAQTKASAPMLPVNPCA